MSLRVEPPMGDWPSPDVSALPAWAHEGRRVIAERVRDRALRLGLPIDGLEQSDTPIVATGHQATLWHPGILAKDVVAAEAARRWGGRALHVVVDQDIHEAWRIDLPRVDGDRIVVDTHRLAPTQGGVPTGRQPAVDAFEPSGLDDLDEVLHQARSSEAATLAEQVAQVNEAHRARVLGRATPIAAASDLAHTPRFAELVGRMTADPGACVLAYNDAVAAVPEAGLTPLRVKDDRFELPLWSSAWQGGRLRVFAERSSAGGFALMSGGKPADRADLLPRALLMTGLWRDGLVDWFIHGTGGGVYSRATDHWWSAWAGSRLAPVAVATADLRLALDAPVAEPEDLRRALWCRHHLPHNLDRELGLDGPLVERKRSLLAQMGDDRDRRRRAQAFREVHAINRAWAAEHVGVLEEAGRAVETARAGLANRAAAFRRDWLLAVYPVEGLRGLSTEARDA
ncbi:MAG: hypothetical protein AAF288_00410 [Planctomycetota bacterium]